MRQRLAMGLCLGLLSLGASGLQGCGFMEAIAQRQAITRTEFNFDAVQFVGADLPLVTPDAGTRLNLIFNVRNPNPVTATLDKLDYTVFLEGGQVATGTMPETFNVPAGETKQLVLPIKVPYTGLSAPVLAALNKRQATFQLKGISHLATPLGTLDFPVEATKTTSF